MLYRPERGWGFKHQSEIDASTYSDRIDDLLQRAQELEASSKSTRFQASVEPRDLRKTWEHKYRAAGRSPHGY